MERHFLRQVLSADANRLTEFLTQRQFIDPHQTIRDVLQRAVEQFGVCPVAVDNTIKWLCFDPNSPIGRLRRTELIQLGRSLQRFWRQNDAQKTPQLQS